MQSRLPAVAAVLAAALILAGAPVRAQDVVLTGTLKAINDRGEIRLGVRDSAIPFAFRNRAGQPIGFSVDLCDAIAGRVATALNRDLVRADAPAGSPGLKVSYVTVAADQRLPKIIAGDIDIECGSTTSTAERAKTVGFSPVFFLAGTRVMTAAASPLASYKDAKAIAVSTGTTNADVVKRLAAQANPPIRIVETPDVPAAYAMLKAGTVDAMASDDVLLAGLIATQPNGHAYHVIGEFLSFEPYALILRRNDPDFAGLVSAGFAAMAESGMLTTRYRRWFTDALPDGENLNLPMSAQLTEMYRALGQAD